MLKRPSRLSPETRDFWLSLIAGVALLTVVFFPTWRPGLLPGAPLCGSNPPPQGCSPIEQTLGEAPTARIHSGAAAVFILSLAAISFLFAHRQKKYGHGNLKKRVHFFCGTAILAAVAWVLIGGILKIDIWGLTPLYVGEITSVWAFGASWLLAGKDLRRLLRLGLSRQPSQGFDTADHLLAGARR